MDQENASAVLERGGKPVLLAELGRVAVRDRWGRALMAVGWVHLGFFLICQALYTLGDRTDWHSVALWILEVLSVVGVVRLAAGPGWLRSTPMAGVVARVWGTYLILAFNVATMNTLTGWTLDWFKPVWCTLGSFGFATMAWLFNPWFLVPAFQMYFTGLLMIRFPAWNYLIHGLSWWLALNAIGTLLEWRRLRGSRPVALRPSWAVAGMEPEPQASLR
jgi:hypothetical protein